MMNKRTFIAVKIIPSENLISAYKDLKNSFNTEIIKWINTDNFHITLKFLGETDLNYIDDIKSVIFNITNQCSYGKILIANFGVFPKPNRPRVLWLGVKNYNFLKIITDNLNKKLENFGFQPEKRKFQPHLTIARTKFIKNTQIIKDAINKYNNHIFQESTVNKIIFYESKLTSKGAIYKPLEFFNLK